MNIAARTIDAAGRSAIFHSVRCSRPIHNPAAATSMAACGPEFPSGIGSGGSSHALTQNSSSQRSGPSSSPPDQRTARSRRGKYSLGTKPRSQRQKRARTVPEWPEDELAPVAGLAPASVVATPALPGGRGSSDRIGPPARKRIEAQNTTRKPPARRTRRDHVERQVGRTGPLRHNPRIHHPQPFARHPAED